MRSVWFLMEIRYVLPEDDRFEISKNYEKYGYEVTEDIIEDTIDGKVLRDIRYRIDLLSSQPG